MSSPEALDMTTFERLLGIHGSQLERWPEPQREPLARLLESSAEARALWDGARALDGLLAALPDVEPAPALLARIASLPARHPRAERARWWPFHGALGPLLGWGVAALLGVLVGVSQAPPTDGVDDEDSADVAALDLADDGSDDWSEVSGLITGADWAAEDE